MREESDVLYSNLQNQLLAICQDTKLLLSGRLELAVQTCAISLTDLYKMVPTKFLNINDEIHFFKIIKPKFASEREYHQRLYHAMLFVQDNYTFWSAERERIKKIIRHHLTFAVYMKADLSYEDNSYFRQYTAPECSPLCMWPKETNLQYSSSRDSWVAGLMALERYELWLEAKQP